LTYEETSGVRRQLIEWEALFEVAALRNLVRGR
jgi:hypothetical protein